MQTWVRFAKTCWILDETMGCRLFREFGRAPTFAIRVFVIIVKKYNYKLLKCKLQLSFHAELNLV